MRRTIGNPDFKRFIGNPDLARRVGFKGLGCNCVRGFGAEEEDIHCPAGTTVNGDAEGNVWCDDGKGNKIAATFTPSITQPVTSSGFGVVGWGMVVAGALLLGAVVMSPSKGRR